MISRPENQIIVIFGASGDLSFRKLLPALFSLFIQDLLPEHFAVLGVGRTPFTDDSFRAKASDAVKTARKEDGEKLHEFAGHLHYLALSTDEDAHFALLRTKIEDLDREYAVGGSALFYCATPPRLFEPIAKGLGKVGLNRGGGTRKIVIEKPFGYDLNSAVALNRSLLSEFNEDQIYRIDHYLGKETVQNILVTRFANGIFEPIWNRNYVHHIEVTSAEDLGIEHRGGYYDKAGALRDMVQNHLLQLVALAAMEPPVLADATSIRNETLKVFQALRPLSKEALSSDVVLGQYVASSVKGEKVRGYREEKNVAPQSRTETYAAIKFFIDNWRWNGVPFYIRTGKRLPTRVTEVVINFHASPHRIFTLPDGSPLNQLILRIQPDEGILFKFGIKVPGHGFEVTTAGLDVRYADVASRELPSAYERLLLNCMQGDATLFLRADAVEATWRFITPILRHFEDPASRLFGYPAGTWGPEAADKLVDPAWRYPCKNLADDGVFCEL